RERAEDIPVLARHFLSRVARQLGCPVPSLEPDAVAALQAYPWPGNIRELENVIERTVVMSRAGSIGAADLPPDLRGGSTETGKADFATHHLPTIERQVVVDALDKTDWNQSRAAVLLGISRKQLRTKMKNLDLLGSDEGDGEEGG
ncbi:MAG: helix-turn-helix domain-containing protein, partial [Thiohalorhabdaceae bacterium]